MSISILDRLLGRFADLTSRRRPWHGWPFLIAMPTLVGLRINMRSRNLFDTETEPGPIAPKSPVDVRNQRTIDGSYNDLGKPWMGMAGTRFGRMASQMANFLDQAGGLWAKGALHGKVGGAFTATATQHGGQETTLFSIITNLLHFGMIIVGLPYSYQGQTTLDEIVGGSPYGATTITGGQGQRMPGPAPT